MWRVLLALVVAVLLAWPLAADFWIMPENRVRNTTGLDKPPGGVCAYAACESLARHRGIKQLYGLRDWARDSGQGETGASMKQLAEAVASRGVTAKINEVGKSNTGFVIDACARRRGCIVAFVDWPRQGDCHAVVLSDLTDAKLAFYENNIYDTNMGLARYEGVRAWFDVHWDGWAVTIGDD